LFFFIGLADRSFTNFLVYLIILVSFAILMNQQLAMFASFANENSLQAYNSCFLLLLTLFSGFIIAPDAIPSWLSFFYWWNPFAWAYRALLINEFYSDRYENPATVLAQLGFLTPNGHVYGQEWLGLYFAYMIPYTMLCITGTGVGLQFFRVRSSGASPTVPINVEHDADTISSPVDIPFIAVNLSFHGIKYEVTASTSKERLTLLQSVNGIFRAGRLTALMGSSGAGKTTLMVSLVTLLLVLASSSQPNSSCFIVIRSNVRQHLN
jgi:ABC-type multidrug transport system fused ATPase/permease subunit